MHIFFPLLTVALIVLKILGYITAPLWLCLLPLFIPLLIAGVLMLFGFLVVLIWGR